VPHGPLGWRDRPEIARTARAATHSEALPTTGV